MFSTLKQRTIALYHFLTTRRPHLGTFVFLSFLFLAGYLLAGVYAVSTGHLSIIHPEIAMATDAAPATQAASAQPSSATDGVGIFMTAVIKILLYSASLMLRLAIFCLAFIIQIAGYNGYLSSTAVNVGWVMVRDVTNMFFVVILLLVAFGTILGLEQYEWKKMLVKFFFAAVLVNFSRVICGVIIDVGQVVMITFVNGIAATAGGNLINAFSMDQIMGMTQNPDPNQMQTSDYFIASLGAIVFSAIILAMMLVFVFMLLSRLIVLWILIVLSPFAFVLSVIPQTQKYASQWWSEFGNHVVVGPAVVFFLWLSFAVVGSGQISNEIMDGSAVPPQVGGQDAAGIGGTMGWTKMSNFAIAIGILLVGAKTAQSLGTVGGSAMSKATDFGKKVAMVASGASAAMWAGGKVKQAGIATAKWGAMNVPVIGGKAWIRRGKTIAARAKGTWEDINQARDRKAKEWDASSKKLRDLQRQKDLGQINAAEYEKRKQEMIDKGEIVGGAMGAIGRGVKRFGMGMLESNVRSNKRVENWEKVAESKKKVTEAETSLSSEISGREKTRMDVEVEIQEIKQKEKGATKRAEVAAAKYAEEDAAYRAAAEAAAPANEMLKAALAELGTARSTNNAEGMRAAQDKIDQIQKDYAPQFEALKKAKGATTIVAATAKVQAEGAAAAKETEESRLRYEMVTGAEGKKMLEKKAAAKEIHEGLENFESLQLTEAKSKEIEHDSHEWAHKVDEVSKELAALRKQKQDFVATSPGDAAGLAKIEEKILVEEKRVRAQMQKMATQSIHTNPSVFAAQSKAKYDHEYGLYRGKHQTSVDQAAQQMIWGNYGIKTPTTAGFETVVDSFHSKHFKNMNYNQTMNSVDGFIKYIQGQQAGGKAITDTDKMISQAIYYQLHNGSWTDDGGEKIATANLPEEKRRNIEATKAQIKTILSDVVGNTADEMQNIELAAKRKGGSGSSQVNLNPSQISGVGEFLSTDSTLKDLVTKDFINKLRTGQQTAVQAFLDANSKKIEQAISSNTVIKGHGISSVDDLIKILRDGNIADVQQIIDKLK